MKQEPIPIGRCTFYIKALSASEILSLRNDQNFYKNKKTRNSKDGNKRRSWCRTENLRRGQYLYAQSGVLGFGRPLSEDGVWVFAHAFYILQ